MNEFWKYACFFILGLFIGLRSADAGWRFWYQVAVGEITRKENKR